MQGRTYKYFTGQVLYPFGHGLSYTSFAYADPKARRMPTARRRSRSTYQHRRVRRRRGRGALSLPPRRRNSRSVPCRAFTRPTGQGRKRTVSFTLDERALEHGGPDRHALGPAGQRFELWVGGGQPVSRPGLATAPGAASSFTIHWSDTGPAKVRAAAL